MCPMWRFWKALVHTSISCLTSRIMDYNKKIKTGCNKHTYRRFRTYIANFILRPLWDFFIIMLIIKVKLYLCFHLSLVPWIIGKIDLGHFLLKMRYATRIQLYDGYFKIINRWHILLCWFNLCGFLGIHNNRTCILLIVIGFTTSSLLSLSWCS